MANTAVIDFKTTNLLVAVSATENITINFDGTQGALLKASGSVDIGLFGFVYLNGTFAFEKSTAPLRVTGEVADWQGHSPEALKAMKDNIERLRQLGVEAIDD